MSPLECTKTLAHSCILALEVSQSWYTGHTWGERVKQWRQLKKNACLTPTQHGSTPPMKHTKREIIENVSAMCFHLCSDGFQVTKFTLFFFISPHINYDTPNKTLPCSDWIHQDLFLFSAKSLVALQRRGKASGALRFDSVESSAAAVFPQTMTTYIYSRETPWRRPPQMALRASTKVFVLSALLVAVFSEMCPLHRVKVDWLIWHLDMNSCFSVKKNNQCMQFGGLISQGQGNAVVKRWPRTNEQ